MLPLSSLSQDKYQNYTIIIYIVVTIIYIHNVMYIYAHW